MATAKKLPSGNYRCRASITDENGNRVTQSFTAETARKAETLASMWQEGMLQRSRETATHGITLGDAIDSYIETCRCAGMSPSTILNYKSARNNAFPLLISKRIGAITVQDIQRQLNARSKTCKPKTLHNNLNLLSATLKQHGIKLDYDALRIAHQEREEMQIPSDEQITALLRAASGDDDLYISILLAAVMGLRRSEICALDWKSIDLLPDGTATLTIDKALVPDDNGGYSVKGTKTSAGTRRLAIPAAVLAELKRRRSLRPALVNITPNAITSRYERMTRSLGIPGRFHDLRHYHASVMIREGVPEKYIVADMGHASFDMVRRVYGHVMGEKQQEIDARMNDHASRVIV